MNDDAPDSNDSPTRATHAEGEHAARLLVDLAPARELPPFARSFPPDPKLLALVRAFERGQYDVVRCEAPALAESAGDPNVAEAARELRRRLDVDPLAIKLLLGAIALLLLLAAWAYVHQH